ncbi:Metallothionein-like protein 2 [Melia azedarach]|uniref:Metallothionein-like protein 2 n=1 Tax=Melia azedarach TaxID=155640 RepID=A0ACC1X1A9_MELAZ|nr:Metallothionein-like protein 2 [Melia azedarach]
MISIHETWTADTSLFPLINSYHPVKKNHRVILFGNLKMACCGGNVPEASKSCGCEGEKKNVTAESLVPEVAPQKAYVMQEGAEASGGCENGGCKCGPTCNCNPCTCK